MAESAADCFARAALARAAAEVELLPNAREKHLLSADVWEALAIKARKIAEGQLARSEETALIIQ